MNTSFDKNSTNQTYISDFAVLIKKMRLVRKLRRKQAAHFLPFDHKNLEKLENGRGNISTEQFKMLQSTYGFSDSDVEALRLGKYKAIEKAQEPKQKITTKNRKDRRFCHRKITRECKVLKEMRLMKDVDQYTASKDCKYGRNTVGFIENGRVTLTEKKIRHIVETYGFTMELFQQLLKQPILRHEIIEQCQDILSKLDENKLRVIFPMLQSMASN
ncbi:helix-turn-helix transcriptional regulator [Bdellovibrio sp.]|jgi:transcriptional regulator with XRE-family HTH domain|uniref:helix-turn-helix transcriptional regulator n=1 Tax=Bdellovibrio sp. TaxID=28201 RepID=UPI003221F4B4